MCRPEGLSALTVQVSPYIRAFRVHAGADPSLILIHWSRVMPTDWATPDSWVEVTVVIAEKTTVGLGDLAG